MYATQDDLIKKFGEAVLIQRTDRTNIPPTTIDSAVVGQALADADAAIDSYLKGRYLLPLESPAPILTAIGRDLAAWGLFGDSMGEAVRRDRDEAMRLLRDLACGRARLDLGDAQQPAPAAGGPAISTRGRAFDADSLDDYR